MRDKAVIKEKTQQLVEMTSGFCDEYLDEEYQQLCEKLIRKMARKRKVPFISGRMDIWAAVVIHVIGKVNFLSDKSFEPYVPVEDFCNYFGVSRSTVTQKSKLIMDTMKISLFDDEFSTRRTSEHNPLNKFTVVDGFIVPIEYVMQEVVEQQHDDVSQGKLRAFVLKVTLSDFAGRTRGKPYRIIGIKGDDSLSELAEVVLAYFDFDFDHSFGFYDNITNWINSREKYDSITGEEFDAFGRSTGEPVDKVSVSEVFVKTGKKMLFLYDYGDEWHFIVELLKTEMIGEDMESELPVLLESSGAAPSQYGYDEEDEFEGIAADEVKHPSQTNLDLFG